MSLPSQDQVAEKWGEIASDYERAFEGLSVQFAAEALRLLGLQPGARVLDVAAGTGAFSLQAARAGFQVLATDFSADMVARIRQRAVAEGLPGITAEVMDGQALAVADGVFDASVSVLGLIFFPDIPKGIAELRRVLKPGGRAAIVCWNDARTLPLMTLVMQAIRKVIPDFQPPPAPPVWARLCGAAVLTAGMQAAGFREIEVSTVTRPLEVRSPQAFWSHFTRSAPPLAYLFAQLGPERTEAVGAAFVENLRANSPDGALAIPIEACVGIGRA